MTDASGLVYLRARYYVPALGVFPSLDPVEEGNRYGYVGGNVANRVDPSGEKPLLKEFAPCSTPHQTGNDCGCFEGLKELKILCESGMIQCIRAIPQEIRNKIQQSSVIIVLSEEGIVPRSLSLGTLVYGAYGNTNVVTHDHFRYPSSNPFGFRESFSAIKRAHLIEFRGSKGVFTPFSTKALIRERPSTTGSLRLSGWRGLQEYINGIGVPVTETKGVNLKTGQLLYTAVVEGGNVPENAYPWNITVRASYFVSCGHLQGNRGDCRSYPVAGAQGDSGGGNFDAEGNFIGVTFGIGIGKNDETFHLFDLLDQ